MNHQAHQGHQGLPTELDALAKCVVDSGLAVHRELGPVEETLIVEIKAVESLTRLHEAQIITYLKLSRRRLGFLINFNSPLFKEGIRRFAL